MLCKYKIFENIERDGIVQSSESELDKIFLSYNKILKKLNS